MSGMSIKVNALSVGRALGKRAGDVNSAIEKAANAAARKMAKLARDAVSINSGKLKRSIGAEVTRSGRKTNLHFMIKSIPGKRNPRKDPIYYWDLVEYGGVTRASGKRMAIPVGDEDQYLAHQAISNPTLLGFRRMFTPRGSDVILGDNGKFSPAEVAYILVDSVRNKPRPYMKPALRQVIPELKSSIAKAIAKILTGSSAGVVSNDYSRSRSGAQAE